MAAACLDLGVAGERFDARACLPASGCVLPNCPAIRAGAFFLSGAAENYIAVELRRPLEACAMIWPVVEPETAPPPSDGSRWRRTFAGGLLSLSLHLSAAALAIGFLPAATELPEGSEVSLPVDVIDEAAFAALMEGTAKGQDFPAVPLPEPVEPAEVQQSLANEAIAAVAAPDPEVPMPQAAPPVDMAMFPPAETKKKIELERQPSRIETKNEKPPRRKPRKALPEKGVKTAAAAAGRQGAGPDAVSTASAVRGKGSRTDGMRGKAADSNLRSRIVAHLGRHKRYPDAAMMMRLEGSVGVTFSVGPDGSLKSATISTSSGHTVLDREVLAMLRRAAPFPVPSGGEGITITTRIGFIHPR